MTTIQKEFEKHLLGKTAWDTSIKTTFEAGFLAAFKVIEESNPDCYRGQEGVTDLAYDAVAPYYPLYKLPENL